MQVTNIKRSIPKGKGYLPVRWCFEFHFPHEIVNVWVPVKKARKAFDLRLQTKHAEDGVPGSTTDCPGALCMKCSADLFPHPVGPHVIFTPYRMCVESKTGKDRWPLEGVVYEHNRPDVVALNDTPEGNVKLAKLLREGEIDPVIKLKPYRVRSEKGRPGEKRKSTGVRKLGRKLARGRWDAIYPGVPYPGDRKKKAA